MRKLHYLFFWLLSSGCIQSNKIQLPQNSEIVVVNIGLYNRVGISEQINFIKSLNPKVIAVDIFFDKEVNDYQDSLMVAALKDCKNLVMAVLLEDDSLEIIGASGISGTLAKFQSDAAVGYTNVLLDGSDPPLLKRFVTYEKIGNQTIYHFSIQAALLYDSLRTVKFLSRNDRITNISYYGNQEKFKMFSPSDVLDKAIKKEAIENKIVLIGYAGPYEYFPINKYDNDKFYTPLNINSKNSAPDMYGVIYLANLIVQVLNGK